MEYLLRLREISCAKTNEAQDDVFCTITGRYAGSEAKFEDRFPNVETWQFVAGQSVGPNEVLFSGAIDAGLSLCVTFYEEDAMGLVKAMNDHLGGFMLTLSPADAPVWQADRQSEYKGMENGLHKLRLLGAKAEYQITLQLFRLEVV